MKNKINYSEKIKSRNILILFCLLSLMNCSVLSATGPYHLLQDDILTLSGGTVDAQNNDIYIMDMGYFDNTKKYPITINREKGQEANYPVSISLKTLGTNMQAPVTLEKEYPEEYYSDTIIFAPGVTSRTVYIVFFETSKIAETTEASVYLSFYCANRTKLAQSVIQAKFKNPNPITINPITDSSCLIDHIIGGFDNSYAYEIGGYRAFFGNYTTQNYCDEGYQYSKITSDQTMSYERQMVDHQNIDVTASDASNIVVRNETVPVRESVGEITRFPTYLFKLTEEDIICDYPYDWGTMPQINFKINGVNNIKQEGVRDGLNDVANISWSYSNPIEIEGYHQVYLPVRLGEITSNKASYNSNEAVILSIPFLNWKLYKKLYKENWLDNIQLTLNNGQSFISSNRVFDESTGVLSFTFNAPQVMGTSDSTLTSEIVVQSTIDYRPESIYPYGAFKTITIRPQSAPIVLTENITVEGVPAQNKIFLEKKKTYQLIHQTYPADCSFLNAEWSSSDTEVATITSNGLLTAKKVGNVTLTLTSDEVAWRKNNGEPDNDNVLIKNFNIVVKDSLPKTRGTSKWFDIKEEPEVVFYHNLKGKWVVVNNTAQLKLTHANGMVKTIDLPIDTESESFLINRVIRYKPVFDELFPKTASMKSEHGYDPCFTAEITLPLIEDDGEKYNITAISSVYIRLLSPNMNAETKDVFYTGEAENVTAEITNLTQGRYKIKYTLLKLPRNVLKEESYESASGTLPSWLTITPTEDNLYCNATVNTSFIPELPILNYPDSYHLKLTIENAVGDISEQSMHIRDVFTAASIAARLSIDGIYYEDETQMDNKQEVDAINALVYQGKSYEEIYPELITVYKKNQKRFSFYAPYVWGSPVVRLKGGSYDEEIEVTSSYFQIFYPFDDNTYRLTVSWPKVNVSKTFDFTSHSLDEKNMYVFAFSSFPDKEETVNMQYMNRDSTIVNKTIPSSRFCLYEPDGIIGNITITSSNPNRPSIVLDTYKSGWGTVPSVPIKSYQMPLTPNYVQIPSAYGELYVRLFDESGNEIRDAKLNYVGLDKDNNPTTNKGSVTKATDGIFKIPFITAGNSMMIEIIADGYGPQCFKYSIDSKYYNYKLDREQNIILRKGNYSNAEILGRYGRLYSRDNIIRWTNDYQIDLSKEALSSYSPYTEQMSSNNYRDLQLNITLAYNEAPSQLKLIGSGATKSLYPQSVKTYDKDDYGFENTFVDVSYDLMGFLEGEAKTYPYVKAGSKQIVRLPGIMNQDINVKQLENDLGFGVPTSPLAVENIHGNAKSNGADLKDTSKAFEKFNITLPSSLPFTINVEREGNKFWIKGVAAINFVPGGQLMDLAESAQDFTSLYYDCMNAVRNGNSGVSKSNKLSSAFVGIRGYISGMGVLNPETGKVDVTLWGGGLSLEASASISQKVSFGIGSFGMGLEGKLATGINFINASATDGSGSGQIKMDIIIDTEVMLKIWAWAEGGLDIFIVKAVVGVEGGGSISHTQRTVFRPYGGPTDVGFKTTLEAYMKAYAEWRVLWWGKRKEWGIFNCNKTFLTPNNSSNPFHKNYKGTVQNSTKLLSSVYRPANVCAVGSFMSPIIENVGANAYPRYLSDGNSLLFTDINAPSDNNDDRLKIYNSGQSAELIQATTPSFAFDVASANDNAVVALEQLSEEVLESDLTDFSESTAIQLQASKVKIIGAVRKGETWETDTISKNQQANMHPRVALQKADGKAVVIWSSGEWVETDDNEGYMNGELLLSRYNGNTWGLPVSLVKLDKSCVLGDYSAVMSNDTVLIAASQQIKNEKTAELNKITFISVDPDNNVETTTNGRLGQNLQLKRVGDVNIAAFLTQTIDSVQDVFLNTVNMRGHNSGSISHFAGLTGRTVQNIKLAVDESATDLDGIAILWNEPIQTPDPVNIENFTIETALYAAKLGKLDDKLFTSEPVKLMTVPDGYRYSAYDTYLKGLNLRSAVAISNEQQGADIVEENVTFANSIECTGISYPMEKVNEGCALPVDLTIKNNGYRPISKIEVTMNNHTETLETILLPGETTTAKGIFNVTENFDGTINYDINAVFSSGSTSLKTRSLKSPGSRVFRAPIGESVTKSGSNDITVVDMNIDVISNSSDDTQTMILAKVGNNSAFPLKDEHRISVGLYKDAQGLEVYPGTDVVTILPAELFNKTENDNSNKVVAFNVNNVSSPETAFVVVSTTNGTTTVTDNTPINNVQHVQLLPLREDEDVDETKVDDNFVEKNSLSAVSIANGIQVSKLQSGENISVFNTLGYVMYDGKVTEESMFIPIQTTGVYFIKSGNRSTRVLKK